MWATFATKRQKKLYMKFVCKVFLDFPIPSDQANLYRLFTNWLSLLEPVNLKKTCSKLHVKWLLWSKLPTYFDDVTTIEMTSRQSASAREHWCNVSCDIPYWKKIIRLTKSVKLWYCTGICPCICISFCKACIPWYFLDFACKHDIDWTISARTVKLGTMTSYDRRTTPIAFEGQGSKVMITRLILVFNFVNKIKTESFGLGLRNFVDILVM